MRKLPRSVTSVILEWPEDGGPVCAGGEYGAWVGAGLGVGVMVGVGEGVGVGADVGV